MDSNIVRCPGCGAEYDLRYDRPMNGRCSTCGCDLAELLDQRPYVATIGKSTTESPGAFPETYEAAAHEAFDMPRRANGVPQEISGWNWGAFFLSPLWMLFHGKYGLAALQMTFATFLGKAILFGGSQTHIEWVDVGNPSGLREPATVATPFNWSAVVVYGLICLIFMCVSGFGGNEWAWDRKSWDSIAQFKQAQRFWAIIGLAVQILFWTGVYVLANPQIFPDGSKGSG